MSVPPTPTSRAAGPSRPTGPQRPAAATPSDLLPGVLLLVAGLLVGVAALVGVVAAADGGPRGGVPVAAFVAALPGLAAVVVGARRPTAGLALAAAAGWWGLARLLNDLSLLGDPGAVVRPELFAETSVRSQPFGSASGVGVLLVADVLAIVAAVLATRAVAPRLLPDRPTASSLFGDPGAAEDVPETGPATTGRTRWSLPVVLVGLLGVVLVAVGALDPGYVGGFLDLRALPPGTTLLGVLGLGLAVIVAAGLVLVAGATRRSLAVPLLVGSALAAAVPFLVALVVVIAWSGDRPPGLAGSVWWGLAGAVLLGVAGRLAPRDEGTDNGPAAERTSAATGPSDDGSRFALLTGVLALAGGAACLGAAATPFLLLDGAEPVGATAEVVAPLAAPFVVASVPLFLAGILTLAAPTRRAGLIAAGVVWAGPLLAATQALAVREAVLFSAARPVDNGRATAVPTWTDGTGFWLAWSAVLAALAAAVLGAVAARRLADSVTQIPDDASVAESRPVRTGAAIGLAVLTLVALSLPVWSTLGTGASSTLLSGYDVQTWGHWAVAIAVLVAVAAAARTVRTDVAIAAPLAAASVAVQPLLVPAAIRGQVGFTWSPGLWLVGALVVLLVASAPVFGAQATRIRPRTDRPRLPA